jgi:hypothetical protein
VRERLASEAPQPDQATHEYVETAQALPEAPASATAKVMLGAYEVLLTVRDTDESRLLARLEALLKDQRIQPVPKPAPRSQGPWKQRRDYAGR